LISWRTWFDRPRRDGRDVLLTGLPRSGTTLACKLLNGLPDVVALHEPLRHTRFGVSSERSEVVGGLPRWLRETRARVLRREPVPALLVEGEVPDNYFGAAKGASGERLAVAEVGGLTVDKPLPREFWLVVKQPVVFTALLEELVRLWPVHAIVRNPVAVLSSWSSVDLTLRGGRMPAAELLDLPLFRKLARIEDPDDRQIHLLEWMLERYLRLLPRDRIVRYEDVVATRGKALASVVPSAAALDANLESRNRNPQYATDRMRRIGEKLLATTGPVWDLYTRESVESLLR
jgi:hypothetical protein